LGNIANFFSLGLDTLVEVAKPIELENNVCNL
jgi:hypothetical protein